MPSRNWTKSSIFQKCVPGSTNASEPCFLRPYDSYDEYKSTQENKPYIPALEVSAISKSGKSGKVKTCASHINKIYGFATLIRNHNRHNPEDPSDLSIHISQATKGNGEQLNWPLGDSSRRSVPTLDKDSRQRLSDAMTTLKAFDRKLESSAVQLAERSLWNADLTREDKRIYAEVICEWALERSAPASLKDKVTTFRPSIRTDISVDRSLWDGGHSYKSLHNNRSYTPREVRELQQRRRSSDASAMTAGSDLLIGSLQGQGQADTSSDDEDRSTLEHSVTSLFD
ncbi:hypothetical protein L486_08163 [Kwoniella mangroviensis CBS 10435]|uniref:Uncharacterized protein n=1 Tax=Kwoniella mangroviensis CBS 10435 TaxID=1331196 RepID=A0A1B9IF32_9TREE|nr:hypothetical protein L486_08163 [Kwoniella mangroviensis CBS 10435]